MNGLHSGQGGLKVLLFLPTLYCFLDGSSSLRLPLGSLISPTFNPNYWYSPKADYAFGFFNHSDLPDQYVVGIRFNSEKIPSHEQSVVWLAGGGGGVIVGQHSYFLLAKDGNMVLFDGTRRSVAWSSCTGHLSVVSAALQDDGNLVLLNAAGIAVWQSFNTPFDTLLPGQNLSNGQLLRAASANEISSYYSLRMEAAGQLMLLWESNASYWSSDAIHALPLSTLTFTHTGTLELLDDLSTTVWYAFADDHNDPTASFRYLRLDVDGNLRMYSWYEKSKSWKVVWQAVQNQCKVFATCGLHGVCVFAQSGSTDCICPFMSASNSSVNCVIPYKYNCSSGSTMTALKNTFLYGIYPPHDLVINIGTEGCRRACLDDPLCTSASVSNDGSGRCWLKRTQFVSGFQHPSLASLSFVKECLNPLAVLPQDSSKSLPSSSPSPARSSRKFWSPYFFIGASLVTFFLLLAIQIIFGLAMLKRRRKSNTKGISTLSLHSIGVVSLSYAEIQRLTDDFREQLGPNMHKGLLPGDQIIVVKDLKDLMHVEEKQFRCWISVLGSLYHKNLVKLVAYSYSADHRFAVYPFAKNGSVGKWLEEAKQAKRLNWTKRMDICLGVARALSYLHSGCREFISHGNLKWENVVLDEQFEAKLTDFGFGKFSAAAAQGGFPAEEDVAKFGEMLIVMVSGNQGGSDVCWLAYKEWAACRLDKLVDSRMAGKADFGDMERVLRVAFWCLQDDVRLRPSMSEVIKVLEGTLPVDPPPPPYHNPEKSAEESLQIETFHPSTN